MTGPFFSVGTLASVRLGSPKLHGLERRPGAIDRLLGSLVYHLTLYLVMWNDCKM